MFPRSKKAIYMLERDLRQVWYGTSQWSDRVRERHQSFSSAAPGTFDSERRPSLRPPQPDLRWFHRVTGAPYAIRMAIESAFCVGKATDSSVISYNVMMITSQANGGGSSGTIWISDLWSRPFQVIYLMSSVMFVYSFLQKRDKAT